MPVVTAGALRLYVRFEWVIVSLALFVGFGSSYLYLPNFLETQRQVDRLGTEPTLLEMELDVAYPENSTAHGKDKGPVLHSESWHITDQTGVTHLRYHARSDSMLGILDLPGLRTLDAAALYDQLVDNQVWNLPDEEQACSGPKREVCYGLHIRTKRGNAPARDRVLRFDDEVIRPQRRRELRIHLDERRSTESQVPAMVFFQAPDPGISHYGLLVHAFKVFGDRSIQQGIVTTRTRVLGVKVEGG